ncbi:MAG: Eco57I restriction-modification methylase domain-containing protein [Salinarimonas sp.]
MELFAIAGLMLPPAGGGKRAPAGGRSLRVPLFNHDVVESALQRAAFAPSPEARAAAAGYARAARAKGFTKKTESAVRGLIRDVFVRVLGYTPLDPEGLYTLAEERPVRRGAVDIGLGRFDDPAGIDELVAPLEIKGPGTTDLDRVDPGRRRSPVQQAWDYAVDTPGARWVLVTNGLELRLYGFGRGRDAYEIFDLTRLDEESEHARLWLLVGADQLLGGAVDALLAETDTAYKRVTDELYVQYKGLRTRLIAHLVDGAAGPRLAPLAAIAAAQKILDRVLFIAFSQRNGLLPSGLLEQAAATRNKFVPQPLWLNFQALFRAVDRGHADLEVLAYNGGLFAPDPALDALVLPDPLAADVAALGDWDYRREVPVTVLGHVFEQSITDLEQLKAESTGAEPPHVSKRKREGVVYTPDVVTRFVVERTIGTALDEALAGLRAQHGVGETPGADADAERAVWRGYLALLRRFRVVDPACGSGAFLVAAFDELARRYRDAVTALDALGEPAETVDFDVFDEIVTKNLYGVDLNHESVEITRLSLWLKTARRQHKLQNLEHTIKVGNSLVADPSVTDAPFVWKTAFPGVFEAGGFDVVIGNPPYVRMEYLKPVKPYLEKVYAVAADRADLYAYFFERGAELLKPGGRLGYISSSTFFRTGSGENLRAFLSERMRLECVVDFGDTQIFEGVTTYPAILTARAGPAVEGDAVSWLVQRGSVPADLGRAFDRGAQAAPLARFGRTTWSFENDARAALREKLATGRRTLGEVYGAPLRGIVTGLNEAFVVPRAIRDRLVADDPNADALLVPFLRGEDVKRWRTESEDHWLINIPKGAVDIDDYPSLRGHLRAHKHALERRATKQEWFELQQAQAAYQPKMRRPKILYPHFQNERMFTFDDAGVLSNDKSYCIPTDDFALLAFLNSRVAWFLLSGIAPAVRNGWHEMRVQYVERLPIPDGDVEAVSSLVGLGRACLAAAGERHALAEAVRHRIGDLARGTRNRLTRRLSEWWALDFAAFREEVRKAFGIDVPVSDRDAWEGYLATSRTRYDALDRRIADADASIDQAVYRLFDLTEAEIALVEAGDV